MKLYYINNKKYYRADDLWTSNPSFFKGCKVSKSVVKNTDKIPQNRYIFARKINNIWIATRGNSRKFDKLFISKKWYDVNHNNDKVETEPNLIHLDYNEMFANNDDNLIDIEVRGEREFDKCYFRVKDIMDGFGLKNLHVIINEGSGFHEDVHYKYFYSSNFTYPLNKKSRHSRIKKLYLTYRGLLKVLFGSRNETTDKFVTWVAKTLFAAHLGHEIQKYQLVANLMGVSPKVINAIFNKTIHKIPCIYLFYIGKVKKLRETLNIDDNYLDNSYVCKWGMSCDLERRTKEHQQTYGKFKNANLKLLIFCYIDVQYISKAEKKVKRLFENMEFNLVHNMYKELAIIPKNKMGIIKKQYDMIADIYMGHVKELVNKIKEKDNEILLLKKDLEIAQFKLKEQLSNSK